MMEGRWHRPAYLGFRILRLFIYDQQKYVTVAKIKVILRRSKDSDRQGRICYYLTAGSRVGYLSTEMTIDEERWDSERSMPLASEDGAELNRRIGNDLRFLQLIVRQLDSTGRKYYPKEIIGLYRNSGNRRSFPDYLDDEVSRYFNLAKTGTALNYQRARISLERFLAGRRLLFIDMTREFVKEYADYLAAKGLGANSLSFHMRILRAVFNRAVRKGDATGLEADPFADVFTGVVKSGKAGLSWSAVERLIKADLPAGSREKKARDIFMFCLYARGMEFVDVAFLTKADLENDVLSFVRRSGGTKAEVRLEAPALEIIREYTAVDPESPFLFPILDHRKTTDYYKQYKAALRKYNLHLSQLSELLSLSPKLSSSCTSHKEWKEVMAGFATNGTERCGKSATTGEAKTED